MYQRIYPLRIEKERINAIAIMAYYIHVFNITQYNCRYNNPTQ